MVPNKYSSQIFKHNNKVISKSVLGHTLQQQLMQKSKKPQYFSQKAFQRIDSSLNIKSELLNEADSKLKSRQDSLSESRKQSLYTSLNDSASKPDKSFKKEKSPVELPLNFQKVRKSQDLVSVDKFNQFVQSVNLQMEQLQEQ